MNAGDNVYIDFTSGTATDGQFAVTSVVDEDHFTVTTTGDANQTQNGLSAFALRPPVLVRSGDVTINASTFNMNNTDGDLTQTPLNSPTVFNYFFPDFKFQGILASAGLTTPEFQLTSDTSVANQHNFLAAGIFNPSGNTAGLSSFKGGGGAIALDLGPYMSLAYTQDAAAVGSLVDAISSLLVAGQLSASAKTTIVNYVANTANFPYSNPPTATQMRDRVRSVVHLIVTSPDFTIQR